MAAIELEGLRELNQAIRRSTDVDLPKRMGQANKEIGRKFISQWLEPKSDPAAVGTGTGATVRPSASKREVQLRVGGKHRAGNVPQSPWGKKPGPRAFRQRPKRPFITRSAERRQTEITDAWMQAVEQAMKPAFHN